MSMFGADKRTEMVLRIYEQIMVDHDLNQKKFCLAVDIHPGHISHMKNGRRNAGEEVLRKIGRAFPEWRPAMETLLLATEEEVEEMTFEQLEQVA